MIKNSEILSVKQLLDKLYSLKLFIGQRAFEWNKIKVTNLIDSLLRGFPIGSMLIDKGKQYYNLSLEKQHPRVIEAKENHNRIIDGQQRCISIKASYTKEGLYNKELKKKEILWINVIEENKLMKEFDEKKSQKYLLHWSSSKKLNTSDSQKRKEEFDTLKKPKNGWIKLYELVEIILSEMKNIENESKKDYNTEKDLIKRIKNNLLKKLNCKIRIDKKHINGIIKAVYFSLERENIPIHYLPKMNDDVNDLFNIFIRINTGGVQLNAVDVFFTGIKKYWHEAEEYLKDIVNEDSIFDRKNAITILARCAGKSLSKNPFDPYRMGLNQITRNADLNKNGKEKYPLVMKMEQLVKNNSTNFVKSIKWVTKIMRNNLYYASKLINKNIIMIVVGWAYQYLNNNNESDNLNKLDDNIVNIINFLFWTQVLGSISYGRGKFKRECFRVSWKAGIENNPFPWENDHFQKMCFDYDRVRNKTPKNPNVKSLKDEENPSAQKIRNLLFSRHSYFLSIYQKISFKNNKIDWDHIIAYNYARRKFTKNRKLNWNYVQWVNQGGNFSGIDRRINRMLQDKPPTYKFRTDDKTFNYRKKEYIKTNPMLNEEEIKMCIDIEKLFNDKKIDEAASKLKEFSCNRSKKIWDNIIEIVGAPPYILPNN